jgi:hypothetical protein
MTEKNGVDGAMVRPPYPSQVQLASFCQRGVFSAARLQPGEGGHEPSCGPCRITTNWVEP